MLHPKLRRAAVVLLLLGAAPAAHAAGGEQRLRAFLDDVDSLSAQFEQTQFDDRMRRLEDARGALYLLRPDRFRWDYETPFPQAIVGDGERVWVYNPDLEQVTVKRMDAAIGDTPAVLLSSRRPLSESFEVRDLGERAGLAWVGLAPRSEDATFADIRLAFDGQDLRLMELVDNFGQTTVLRFVNLERNPDLSPDLFRFTPPDGTDVIGDTGP